MQPVRLTGKIPIQASCILMFIKQLYSPHSHANHSKNVKSFINESEDLFLLFLIFSYSSKSKFQRNDPDNTFHPANCGIDRDWKLHQYTASSDQSEDAKTAF
jgi:hypothetical protein